MTRNDLLETAGETLAYAEDYVDTRIELAKLAVAEKGARLAADAIAGLVVATLALFAVPEREVSEATQTGVVVAGQHVHPCPGVRQVEEPANHREVVVREPAPAQRAQAQQIAGDDEGLRRDRLEVVAELSRTPSRQAEVDVGDHGDVQTAGSGRGYGHIEAQGPLAV